MSIKTMMAAFAAITLTAVTTKGQTTYLGPALPITNIISSAGSVTLNWDDYSDITGFKLYTTPSLDAGQVDWQPMTDAQTGLTRINPGELGDHVFALGDTTAVFPGVGGKGFYRLVAVKGDPRVIPDGNGGHYVKVGDDGEGSDIYLKTDGDGNLEYPPTYWINVPGSPTQVWPDGKGGWTTSTPPPFPYSPDTSVDWWDRVDHTLVINLNTYKVSRLPANHNVKADPASKTDHLYLRYITATPPGTNDWMGALVVENSPPGKTNLTLSGYYVGVYAVTEAQYRHVMGFSPSSSGDDRPVVNVSYNELRSGQNDEEVDPATAPSGGFLWALSNKVHSLGGVALAFDLPTEAQWEVACRAGTVSTLNNTNAALNEVAWWSGNNNQAPYYDNAKPVGLKLANQAGLYDMHGNVWEFCLDRWDGDIYDAYAPVDGGNQPVNSGDNDRPSIRGGSWGNGLSSIRSASRSYAGGMPSSRYAHVGFRLCARGEEVPEP